MENAINQSHQIFFYLPLALFIAALICDLLYWLKNKNTLHLGHWFIIAGVIMCIPTIITGQMAARSFDPTNIYLEKHRFLGFVTGVSASLYSGLRIAAMQWNLEIKPVFYSGLSALMVSLFLWSADYGFLMTLTKKNPQEQPLPLPETTTKAMSSVRKNVKIM